MVGRFKGNVNVHGELTVEPGASIQGEVRAEAVFVRGDVSGQIVAARRVELSESGTITGDVKAETLTVTAGSKMKGQVEFGWKEDEISAAALRDPVRPAPVR
jgi:cytoskeletal protein CcmA (bactofilin family)